MKGYTAARIGFVLIVVGLVFTIIVKNNANSKIISGRSVLPAYRFYALDNAKSASGTANGPTNTCIIYFDPECEHCEEETKLIVKNIAVFNQTHIVMVSANDKEKILAFSNRFGLNSYGNISLFWDKEHAFQTWFGHADVPSMYIYNKQNRLVKEYHGETRIEALAKALR